MTAIDPAAVMNAHAEHRGGLSGACVVRGFGTVRYEHCEPYRLAEALAAERTKVTLHGTVVNLDLAEVWDEGWNAAGEEAVMLTGVPLPTPQDNPYRAALANQPEQV